MEAGEDVLKKMPSEGRCGREMPSEGRCLVKVGVGERCPVKVGVGERLGSGFMGWCWWVSWYLVLGVI